MSDDIPSGLKRGRYRTVSNKKSTGKKPYNRFRADEQGITTQPVDAVDEATAAVDDQVDVETTAAPAPELEQLEADVETTAAPAPELEQLEADVETKVIEPPQPKGKKPATTAETE